LPSDSPLEFFIDRSLGRRIVTGALREAGATVHPMAEVYGERVGQGLADTEWLHDAGTRGWVVLMKDDKIRCRPAELEALMAVGVRAFCVTNANLDGRATVERLVTQLPKSARSRRRRPVLTSSACTPTASGRYGRSRDVTRGCRPLN
jgi:hypothetical protein